jgi:diguanylate cyclase (GGDEF)-like protein
LKKLRVFIVEDEALNLMELKDRVEGLGHVVCGTAASGEEAVRAIESASPDLVLMDIRLGGAMDGIEVTRRLHEKSDVPVVYLTAYSDPALIERAVLSGGHGFLVKPVDDRGFRAAIDMAIHRSRAERRLYDVNMRLRESVALLEQQRRDIHNLHKMGEELQQCQTTQDAFTIVGRSLRELFPGLSGFIAAAGPGGDAFAVRDNWGGAEVTPEFVRRVCPTICKGSMFDVGTGHPGTTCPQMVTAATHAYVCIPLVGPEGIIGLLHLDQPQVNDGLSHATVELSKAAAKTIELALANIRLREKLNEQAIRDPLTGLYNRRFMEDMLTHEVAKSLRSANPLGVMMIDIDYFKRFNDTYGHEAGDLLLKEICAFLQTHTRSEDIACRYGGEEFIVIMPDSPAEAARRRAEDLCRGIRGLSFDYCPVPRGRTVARDVAASV